MHRRYYFLIILLFGMSISTIELILSNNRALGSEKGMGNIAFEPAFPNLRFSRPLDIQNAGDGKNRLFVVEQRGTIQVFVNSQNATEMKTFLDIQERVHDPGASEPGLLGLAFHPNYENNGYFYVNYTAQSPLRTVISKFSVSVSDPDSADMESETVILEFDQTNRFHNGGQLAFGPDGYLYIATGDGGPGLFPGAPRGTGQDLRTLLGSLLRIDIDSSDGDSHYRIPEDNPFFGNDSGFREEIFAYGFRNPWRFSFDLPSGRIFLGDVGETTYEEINLIVSGGNYGWKTMEANFCFDPPSGCDTTGLIPPLLEIRHDPGHAVIGGFVYNGSNAPTLKGKYLFGDWVSGDINSFTYDSLVPPEKSLVVDTELRMTSFGIDENNELYVCTFDSLIYWFAKNGRIGPILSIALLQNPIIGSYYDIYVWSNESLLENPFIFLNDATGIEMSAIEDVGENVYHSSLRLELTGQYTLSVLALDTTGSEFRYYLSFSLGKLSRKSNNIIANNDIGVIFSIPGTNLESGGNLLISPIDVENDFENWEKIYPMLAYNDMSNNENVFVIESDAIFKENFKLSYDIKGAETYLFYYLTNAGWKPLDTYSDKSHMTVWAYHNKAGIFGIFEGGDLAIIPKNFLLFDAYPNPFNLSTTIRYVVPVEGDFRENASSKIDLNIYNIRGQLVKGVVNGNQKPGTYEVTWNGTNESGRIVATGIYLIRLSIGIDIATKKLTMLK